MALSRRTVLQLVVGVTVAVGLVAVLFRFVGAAEVLDSLAAAEPTILGGVVLVALCWLGAWGLSLYIGLRILAVPTSLGRALLAFTSVVFANSVMPFAQLGGQPLAALFLSRATRSDYETSLIATATVDVLNVLPAGLFVLVGVATLAGRGPIGGDVALVVGAVLGLSVALPLLGYALWRGRRSVGRYGGRGLVVLGRTAGSVVPGRLRPSPATVRQRVERVRTAVGRLARNPGPLALAFGCSLFGWVFFVGSFWLSLLAVGSPVSFAVVLLVVPTSMLAVVLPSPGGLGGVEAMLVFLTVSFSGIDPASALAAALVHRVATHLLPILIGGTATAVLSS
ncbi:lysylphosphatidylglycerol synthase transmembrane domain-containing protein [Haloglomus litoreum]|uniref:lysylphosphatidylglycerol synthase transmembrane domain-containing protein n=1 Tax=Haloglomus litoreum TaxID=3034026 RepID=UPI0023E8870F|nr:lysylphosphatidylglycerol synthase transmembrane domain-containing protein [Haloglomus sp. DT116]